MSMVSAVVAPDKFRGSLSAPTAAAAIRRGLERAGVENVRTLPMADGGEGTLEALLSAVAGRSRSARVTGPLGDPVDAEYAVLADGTAVVEMARASGLALVQDNDALRASTRGTGELIRIAATDSRTERIIVAVGGSASTDGGIGAVETLRWSLQGRKMVVACDVTTTFLEAARVYGPQKGASPAEVELLSRRLERMAQEYETRTGVDVRALAGSGAAGGLAGGLAALGARLERGFEIVAEAVGLDEAVADCEIVVTAEGSVDATSLAGKVVGGVVDLAEASSVHTTLVVAGQVSSDARSALEARGVVVVALVDRGVDEARAMRDAAQLVEDAVAEAIAAM